VAMALRWPLKSIKVKNKWSYNSIHPPSFMVCTTTIVPFTLNKESQPWQSGVWLPW
jgi:hypothetical protein